MKTPNDSKKYTVGDLRNALEFARFCEADRAFRRDRLKRWLRAALWLAGMLVVVATLVWLLHRDTHF